ncbi:MAG: tpiA [Chlamydiia bacterium]|nr:tpiA [Chlamydiia bacterium]
MEQVTRRRVICGNWKMYKTIDQALHFIDELSPIVANANCNVYLAVPFTAIKLMADKAKELHISIGAQNMNDATEGAFTGEVAALMVKDAGASFVLLGHSERRRVFKEDNAFINRKVKRALQSDLEPILCIGETFEEREEGRTQEVLKEQLTACLNGVDRELAKKLIVAYEPVWAIGSGKAATSEIAEEIQSFCRETLASLFDAEVADRTPLLYGGSVTSENSKDFLNQPNIDGLLIGSASLHPESFAKIIQLCQNSASSNDSLAKGE